MFFFFFVVVFLGSCDMILILSYVRFSFSHIMCIVPYQINTTYSRSKGFTFQLILEVLTYLLCNGVLVYLSSSQP